MMRGKLLRLMLTLLMAASFLVAIPMNVSAVGVEPGDEDLTPPELVEFSFTPTTIDVSAGPSYVTFTLRITDELSGLDYAGWAIRSPSGQQLRYGNIYEWDRVSGTDQDGIYEYTVEFPQYSEAGTWHIDYPWMTDKVGNTIFLHEADLINLGFPTEVESVINEPPVANAGGPYEGAEGAEITFDASASSDPDGDPLQYRWDFDNNGTWDTAWSSDPTASNIWDDDFNGTAKVEVSDGQVTDTDTASVTVNNVSPTVGEITAPVDPVEVNTEINASADFTDPGILDTHTAVWDWGDDSTSAGTVAETNGSVSGSHTYATAGVYTVKLTVTDDDGDSDESIFQYIVVYDPSAGFVTGGGWIDSPEGAYTPDPSLIGKANFGFVSKYKKGADMPSGETEFQFRVANLNFHSTSYQWLVIAGPHAKFKGSGTINGEGDYGFMLTATDGQINGGGDVDKFRIKIWDKATDEIIYDNQMGDADDTDATDAIEGGSIVIHAKK